MNVTPALDLTTTIVCHPGGTQNGLNCYEIRQRRNRTVFSLTILARSGREALATFRDADKAAPIKDWLVEFE